MNTVDSLMRDLVHNKRLSQVHNITVLTDEVDYPNTDQVFPMYPEQCFFLEELNHTKIKGARVLEIGLGSGVLSIGSLKAGAKTVTALEINPRAKLFAGFNAVLNQVSHGLLILEGDRKHIWSPVKGQFFDYIISNPPFMPTPPDSDHYFHSGGGGILGLDFLENIFRELDAHLTENGMAQIVTAAPGDHKLPTTLLELAETYLSGTTTVIIDPLALPFEVLTHHLPDGITDDKMAAVTQELQEKGISHQYLCVIHYNKGEKLITTRFSQAHPAWDMPLENRS